MKRILFLLTTTLLTLSALAQKYTGIRVTMLNGSTQEIAMSCDLTVEMLDGMLIFTNGKTEIKFERSEVSKFTYITPDNSTDIQQTDAETAAMFVKEGKFIRFVDLPKDTELTVTDASGRVYVNAMVSGSYVMNIENMKAGVYVVKAGNVVNKIYIKP